MTATAKIKITGDNKELKQALSEIKNEARQTTEAFNTIAVAGAAAFTGFSAAIAGSVSAFRVQEQALFQQEAIIKATGSAAGVTSDELQNLASSLQSVTTFGDEAIISGQNILLTFKNIGENIFPRVNEVLLDTSIVLGQDLKSSAIQLGKALNDPIQGVTALTRVGVTFTEQQREQIRTLQESGQTVKAQEIILKELESQFGGAARAAAQGTGSFVQLGNVVGDLAEDIGKEFVPFLASAATSLKEFIEEVREGGTVARTLARILAGGAAAAGFATAITAGAIAVAKLKVGLQALIISLNAGRIAAAAFAGALTLGLGLVVAFLPEIIAFTKEVVASFQAAKSGIETAFRNLANNLLGIGSKIGEFLKNLFTFNFSEIKSSAQAVKDAVSKAIDDTFKDAKQIKQTVVIDQTIRQKKEEDDKTAELEKEKQFVEKRKAIQEQARADERAQVQRSNALKKQQEQVTNDIINLEKQNASAEVIRIKEQELALLRSLENAKTDQERELAQVRLDNFRAESEERRVIAQEQMILEREEELALKEEFRALDEEDQALLAEQDAERLSAQQVQRREALRAFAESERKRKQADRKQFLQDEQKHGTAIAKIQQIQRSQEVQGVKTATGELVQLQQSRNSTLKGIGKSAAITQALLATFSSAVNIFNGFSTIPIVGPILGAAGAAAAISFGLEKVSQIRRAQTGGVVPGVGSGDIVPTFLEPGEIVIPKPLAPSFEQQFSLEADPEAAGAGRQSNVTIDTVIGTQEFVDENIIPAIRDAVQFNNADLGF